MSRVRLVGIGCGHPDQLTVEAVEALKDADIAIVARKRADDPLVAAREALIERHAPGLCIVEVEDPDRDRSAASTSTTAGYEGVVADWHEARAERYEQVLVDAGGSAVFLVWGDPAFYDSPIQKMFDSIRPVENAQYEVWKERNKGNMEADRQG